MQKSRSGGLIRSRIRAPSTAPFVDYDLLDSSLVTISSLDWKPCPAMAETEGFEMEFLHAVILSVVIFTATLFGLYGNFCFVFITVKFKDTRSKHRVLLSYLCCLHTVGLIYECLSAIRMLDGTTLYRSVCFYELIPYLLAQQSQYTCYLLIGIDLMFMIFLPGKYNRVRPLHHLLFCMAVSMSYGVGVVVAGSARGEDVLLLTCNPPLSLPPPVNNIRSQINLGIAVAVIVFYIFIIAWMAHKKRRRSKDSTACLASARGKYEQKIIRSSVILMAAASFSWIPAIIIVRLTAMIPSINPYLVSLLSTYAVIPAIVSYSSTYYVYFLTSSETRRTMLHVGLCGLVYGARSQASVHSFHPSTRRTDTANTHNEHR